MWSMTKEERDKEDEAVIKRVKEEMQMLLDFLLKYYPNDFGVGESAIEIAIKLLKKKGWGGYNHIFVHFAGGCDLGKEDTEFACDDEYECIICNKSIKLLSTYEGHSQTPTVFYGRNVCKEKEVK